MGREQFRSREEYLNSDKFIDDVLAEQQRMNQYSPEERARIDEVARKNGTLPPDINESLD